MFDESGLSEIGRGHLSDPSDRSFTIHRYSPSPPSAPWLRVFWIPVWRVPGGETREQRILTYPTCLLSITDTYARLIGPTTAAARVALSGSGWAFGVMLRPGAGRTLLGGDVATLTNRHADLAEFPLLAGLVPLIREEMSADPSRPAAHAAARHLVEDRFSSLPPPAGDAGLVNRIAARVEEDASITTVASLCAVFELQERTLQRLCTRYLGVAPLWLIRQRRLQEAGEQLRQHPGPLGDLAVRLGYADQAHFSRDFRRATGWTPGEFTALAQRGKPTEPGPAPPAAGRGGTAPAPDADAR
ncbi:helix-turn-helix transcriptional regulator [Arthrobacter sp. G119Y2]|uniref:helix-turn-helix transcriptional regulator n=1 Tax=Arthrobacter sp. G119Y2 TaxID=3134965 RepID=UPI0031195E36